MKEPSSSPKNSESIEDQWQEASSQRLLAGGYYKTLQAMLTGMLQFVFGMVILPRIVPISEPSGIITIVSSYLGILGSFFDWGLGTGLQVVLSKSIPAQDHITTVRYVKSFVSIRLITGFIYTILVYFLIMFWFYPSFQSPLKDAYYYSILFLTIPSLWGFSGIFDQFVVATQRFDYDFFISFINFWIDVAFKLLFFWICLTYLFPSDNITAFTAAYVISSLIDNIGNVLVQIYFLKKLKILNMNAVVKLGFDRDAIHHLFSYGMYVWGRGYLMYASESSKILWNVLVMMLIPSPEKLIGFWQFAISSLGWYFMAANLTRPILPAIAEAYGKHDYRLIQSYWNTTMKWYFLWSWFSLGFYIGGGVLYITAFSGMAWLTSGNLVVLIAPAFFLKVGNDYFVAILYAINKPNHALIGSALKIPFLLLGAFLLFKPYEAVGMAITFFVIEAIFFGYSYYIIKKIFHIATPTWIIVIPGIAAVIGVILMRYILSFFSNLDLFMQFVLMVCMMFVFYFLFFVWMGGFEIKDFTEFEGSLKIVFHNEKLALFLVKSLRNIAKISPLYGRFKTEDP